MRRFLPPIGAAAPLPLPALGRREMGRSPACSAGTPGRAPGDGRGREGPRCRPRATGRGGGDPALARRQLSFVCHLHVHRAHGFSACVRAWQHLRSVALPLRSAAGLGCAPERQRHPAWAPGSCTAGTDVHVFTPQMVGGRLQRARPCAGHWGLSSEQNHESPWPPDADVLVREKAMNIVNY